jgi:hypothetical protein
LKTRQLEKTTIAPTTNSDDDQADDVLALDARGEEGDDDDVVPPVVPPAVGAPAVVERFARKTEDSKKCPAMRLEASQA